MKTARVDEGPGVVDLTRPKYYEKVYKRKKTETRIFNNQNTQTAYTNTHTHIRYMGGGGDTPYDISYRR